MSYRIEHLQGCGSEASVDYRIADMMAKIMIFGRLADDLGFTHGQIGISSVEKARFHEVMNGINPRTGQVVGKAVLRVHPDAKLPALPLVEAIRSRAARGVAVGASADVESSEHVADDGIHWPSGRALADWNRLVRGVSGGEGASRMQYTVSVDRLTVVAGHTGIDLNEVYGRERVDSARRAAGERIDVRVRGFDYTFDLDKTTSIALALDPQRDAIEARLRGMTVVFLSELEARYARGVVGHHGDGHARQEVLGKGLFGEITFDPVSREGDPHWHVHFMYANLTRDEFGTWRALSRGEDDLHKNAAAENAAFKSRVRHMLHTEFGWEFEPRQINRDGTMAWRVAGVSEAQVRAASTRQRRIEEYCWANFRAGFDQVSERQQNYARNVTRPGKDAEQHTAGLNNLVEFTRAALREAHVAEAVDPRQRPADPHGRVQAWDASWAEKVDLAAAALREHATARSPTFRYPDARVIAFEALPGLPAEEQDQLVAEALNHPFIISLEQVAAGLEVPTRPWRGVYTTADVLSAERDLEALLTAGANDTSHQLTSDHVHRAFATFQRDARLVLSDEQCAAVLATCTSKGTVAAIQGAAGTGKTTVQAAIVHAYRTAGRTVSGTAHAGVATEILAAEAGCDAATVARLIGVRWSTPVDRDLAWTEVGDVLLVDEAGMIDRRDLAELTREAARRSVKLIVVGDSEQLPAIGATGGFTTVYEHCNARDSAARLFEVRRQEHAHERAALGHWRARRYSDAMAEYLAAGQVRVVDTHSRALTLAAQIYRDIACRAPDPLERAKRVTLVSARNADAAAVGHITRADARADGHVHGPDYRFNTPGGWIDLAAGELVLLKGNRRLVDDQGEATYLRNGRRAVVESISPTGDLTVRWRTSRTNDHSGPSERRAVITSVDINDGWLLPGYVTRGNVLHGAGASTHSTQGGTVDHAVIIGSGIDSPNLAYTALSRDRQGLDLILDIESVAETPEEAAWLRQLPAERQTIEVLDRWLARVTEHGPVDQRALLDRIVDAADSGASRHRRKPPDWLEADALTSYPETATPDLEVKLRQVSYTDDDAPYDPDHDRCVAPDIAEEDLQGAGPWRSEDYAETGEYPALSPGERVPELDGEANAELSRSLHQDLGSAERVAAIEGELEQVRTRVAALSTAALVGAGPHRVAAYESYIRPFDERAELLQPYIADRDWAAHVAQEWDRLAAIAELEVAQLQDGGRLDSRSPRESAEFSLDLDVAAEATHEFARGLRAEAEARQRVLADAEHSLAAVAGEQPIVTRDDVRRMLDVAAGLDDARLASERRRATELSAALWMARWRLDRHESSAAAAVVVELGADPSVAVEPELHDRVAERPSSQISFGELSTRGSLHGRLRDIDESSSEIGNRAAYEAKPEIVDVDVERDLKRVDQLAAIEVISEPVQDPGLEQ